jgi:hypothetical protein
VGQVVRIGLYYYDIPPPGSPGEIIFDYEDSLIVIGRLIARFKLSWGMRLVKRAHDDWAIGLGTLEVALDEAKAGRTQRARALAESVKLAVRRTSFNLYQPRTWVETYKEGAAGTLGTAWREKEMAGEFGSICIDLCFELKLAVLRESDLAYEFRGVDPWIVGKIARAQARAGGAWDATKWVVRTWKAESIMEGLKGVLEGLDAAYHDCQRNQSMNR